MSDGHLKRNSGGSNESSMKPSQILYETSAESDIDTDDNDSQRGNPDIPGLENIIEGQEYRNDEERRGSEAGTEGEEDNDGVSYLSASKSPPSPPRTYSVEEEEEEEQETSGPPSNPNLTPKSSDEDNMAWFGPLRIVAHHPLTAILLLQCLEIHIIEASLKALQRFVKKNDENKEYYVEIGGIPPLGKWILTQNASPEARASLGGEVGAEGEEAEAEEEGEEETEDMNQNRKSSSINTNTNIQRMAIKILAIVSDIHMAKVYIRDIKLINDLQTLAAGSDELIVEPATYIIANLATLHTGRQQIIDSADCLPTLYSLLPHRNLDIEKNVLETLWQIAAECLQVGALVNEGCAGSVVKVVDSNSLSPISSQALALQILEKIACLLNGVPVLEAVDTFSIVAKKLYDDTMADLFRICIRILFHECRDRGLCKKFAYITPTVVDIVVRTQDRLTRAYGIELIGRLCSVENVARGVSQCGIPQLLHDYLIIADAESDLRLKEACAFAIAQIARASCSSKKLFSPCIPGLLEMIQSDKTGPRALEYSLIAVSTIVEGSDALEQFTEGSGVDIFKNLIEKRGDYPPEMVLSALNTMEMLSGSSSHRGELLNSDMLPLLLDFLRDPKDGKILTTVAGIMCSILCEPSTHEEFIKMGGAEALMDTIGSADFSVVLAIVPIINIACSDPELGKTLISKGLLQVMWKRSDLISHKPLRTVFDRLITASPTLKYAAVGHIGPFEKLEDGFCDMGRLKRMDELKMPEDFQWKGRPDPREKIILVDFFDIGDLIESAKSQAASASSDAEAVELIAQTVSERFGGSLNKWRLTAKSEDLEIEELQNQRQSPIVPLSSLKTGAFRVRALLFKALCDAVNIPCSLETGDYKKAWNVVFHSEESQPEGCGECGADEQSDAKSRNKCMENMKKYIVDLVFQPGVRIPLGSFEADTYITTH